MYITVLRGNILYVRIDGVLQFAVRLGDILRGAAFRVVTQRDTS